MVILISMGIVVMILVVMQVHNFFCRLMTAVQILLFSEWSIVYHCTLILEKKRYPSSTKKMILNILLISLNAEQKLFESTVQCG